MAPDGRLLGAGFQAGGGSDVAAGVVAVLTLSATMATAAAALFRVAPQKTADPRQEPDQAPAADPGSDGWQELTDRANQARKLVRELQKPRVHPGRTSRRRRFSRRLGRPDQDCVRVLDLARAELANLQQELKA